MFHLHYTGKYAIIDLQHEAALSRQKGEVLLHFLFLAQVRAVIRTINAVISNNMKLFLSKYII